MHLSKYVRKIVSLFQDDQGNFVIAQPPNAPLILALAFYLLQFVTTGTLFHLSLWGYRIVLLCWAALEITSGDSPFRKILGLTVALSVISSLII